MSDQPDDAWLIALGTDVSDGKSVDWDLADRRATDDEARALVSNLKRLEAVVQAHRSGGHDEAVASAGAVPAATGHWHHLVLFESVGSGAFGTVYRAWDTKVDREVALKLVSTSTPTTRSPLSEARNLAKIRHPNIVTVYGAEQDSEQVGIWMEFIQGETLAEMVRDRGPMSAREVIGIALDLCRALSALQGASLLHRDIKAHNVMREVGGRIVLMDFSGAWTSEAGATPANLSGTPLYMAPELFEGRPASFASDIYSLGVLLFYLLSGRLPVEGASLADLKSAHAKRTRTLLRDLRPELPEAVVQVVERASAHDARERYQTAGELEHALVGTLGAHPALTSSTTDSHGRLVPDARPRNRRLAPWATWTAIAAAVLAVTGFAPGGWFRSAPADDAFMVRFSIGLPENTGSWPRISPDGQLIVYGSLVEGEVVLWLREMHSTAGRAIPHTSARESPFWSPDSRFLAFFEKDKLKRVAVTGGAEPHTIADAVHPKGGDWNRDDVLLFGTDTGLSRVNADGTGLATVTTLDTAHGEYSHGWPEFLPDGRRFLFVALSTQPEYRGLYLSSLDSPGRSRRVMPGFSRTVYSPAGYLLFGREGTLMAQRFDERTGELRGTPEGIAAHIKQHQASDAAFDVSDNGVLIYRLSEPLALSRLMLLDRSGQEIKAVTPVGTYRHPRFSPDGRRIVAESLELGNPNADLWVFDHTRGMASRFTTSDAPDVAPTWSPDGLEIAFSSKRGGRYDIYTKTVDEVLPEKLLTGLDGDKFVENWPEAHSLIATTLRSGLWRLPLEAGDTPSMLRATTSSERFLAEMSPDGRWIAYTWYDSGSPEVFVEPVVRSGSQWQVSARGGVEPHWRADGRELFYMTIDGQISSVEVMATDSTWRTGRETPLFRVAVPDLLRSSDYHVTRDGQRFVVNTILGYPPIPPVEVVVSWTGLLAR